MALTFPLVSASAPPAGDADGAMGAPGGIDLNPAGMNFQAQGDVIEFDLPPNFEPVENIDGLYPVVISITPVTNLPVLLGLEDEEGAEGIGHKSHLGPMDRKEKIS
jgi:hypothetical protein